MKSCKEVSQLLSESMDRKPTFWERVGLRFHLSMCKLCKGFSRNLQQLREAARTHARDLQDDATDDDVTLSTEARERMKQVLKRQDH